MKLKNLVSVLFIFGYHFEKIDLVCLWFLEPVGPLVFPRKNLWIQFKQSLIHIILNLVFT